MNDEDANGHCHRSSTDRHHIDDHYIDGPGTEEEQKLSSKEPDYIGWIGRYGQRKPCRQDCRNAGHAANPELAMLHSRRNEIAQVAACGRSTQSSRDCHTSDDEVRARQGYAANFFQIFRHPKGETAESKCVCRIPEHCPDICKISRETP